MHLLTRKRVSPPLLVPGVWDRLPRGEGVGGPKADEGTDTLVLYIYVYFVGTKITFDILVEVLPNK